MPQLFHHRHPFHQPFIALVGNGEINTRPVESGRDHGAKLRVCSGADFFALNMEFVI
jgi:hypothetical protein